MSDWNEFLSTIPIFSFLSRTELAAVQALFKEEICQKGDVICRTGEEGDTFYVVLEGELEVWAGEGNEKRQTGTLKRGDFFGEMALLQGGKRMATVIVSRRAHLFKLDKASFNTLFLKNPKALEYFSRVLCKRLTSVSKGEGVRRETTTISVTGSSNLKGKSLIASILPGIIHDLTGTNILLARVYYSDEGAKGPLARVLTTESPTDLSGISDYFRPESEGITVLDVLAASDKPAEFYIEQTSSLISKVAERFSFILFDLGGTSPGLTAAAPEFSDIQVDVVEKSIPPKTPDNRVRKFEVVNLFNAASKPVALNSCEPFVLPVETRIAGTDAAQIVRTMRRTHAALVLHRLARKMLKSTVGIALGGGAAFGIAHLGVLKVLETNDIPIDLLAGCSQGSIIGVGYAAGISTDDMIALAQKLGQRKNFFMAMDFTVTKPGVLAGNRIIEIFEPMLRGRSTFCDLIIPCRTVATDIESGERVSIGDGKLSAAFRASASVPMVISPLRRGERVLVDGGVADPVPAEVVDAMGADLCIAVNVVPPLKRGVENAVSRTYRMLNKFNPLAYIGDSRYLPNTFDIIMNALQTLQYELGNFKAISADVLINPDLSDFTWIEYYRADELIKRGADAAERALPAIRKAYDFKLAPYRKRS
jgi:NTE family protein